jgi:hypothetical protein
MRSSFENWNALKTFYQKLYQYSDKYSMSLVVCTYLPHGEDQNDLILDGTKDNAQPRNYPNELQVTRLSVQTAFDNVIVSNE